MKGTPYGSVDLGYHTRFHRPHSVRTGYPHTPTQGNAITLKRRQGTHAPGTNEANLGNGVGISINRARRARVRCHGVTYTVQYSTRWYGKWSRGFIDTHARLIYFYTVITGIRLYLLTVPRTARGRVSVACGVTRVRCVAAL